jgi:hypothetical protein
LGKEKLQTPIHHLLHDVQYQDWRISCGLFKIRTLNHKHQKHHAQHQSISTFEQSWHVHRRSWIVSFKMKKKIVTKCVNLPKSKGNSLLHSLSPSFSRFKP